MPDRSWPVKRAQQKLYETVDRLIDLWQLIRQVLFLMCLRFAQATELVCLIR